MVVKAKRDVDFEHLGEIDSKLRMEFLVPLVVQLKSRTQGGKENSGGVKIPSTPRMAC